MNRDTIIQKIINNEDVEDIIKGIMSKMHANGPLSSEDFELLSYCKKYNKEIFAEYENTIIYLTGLFYKNLEPKTFIDEIYEIFSKSIMEDSGGKRFTPFQHDAYKKINEKMFFSFSSPTSSGKSFLFRELISETSGDIVIVVPSRALISEYMNRVNEILNENGTKKTTLVLSFIENINRKKIKKRIYIITPERGVELFKIKDELNIKLFLFDEAQISEEKIRGMQFDTFVRRANTYFKEAKKVFAHPFISNPEAQLMKHDFINENSASNVYKQLTVGKIFISHISKNFYYFSPYNKEKTTGILLEKDIIEEVIQNNGTILIYVSKQSLYDGTYLSKFEKYIPKLSNITSLFAYEYIEKLKSFIGANDSDYDFSSMVSLMEKGITIHHGSIPLKARYIIEEFINEGHAKICFSTSTLLQGINMPFDIVWIDNFKFGQNEDESRKILDLKNLIGRAGRTKSDEVKFDYGYVIIENRNKDTFIGRITGETTISPKSKLEDKIEDVPIDLMDVYESFKESGFDDNLFLPLKQVDRIKKANIDIHIEYILNNLLNDEGKPLKGKEYQKDIDRKKKIKESFKEIYLSHLRRDDLSIGEKSILSASIPMLLWRIQGKVFREIVGLRKAYITKKDERREIERKVNSGEVDYKEGKKLMDEIILEFSQKASGLPDDTKKGRFPLFKGNLKDFKYDLLVYDTYDYLDKVITFSLINPISAVFQLYYEKTQDYRAKIIENYIRYGTNDEKEILLLRYGYIFEEIEKIKKYVVEINEDEIIFEENIKDSEVIELIDRYL